MGDVPLTVGDTYPPIRGAAEDNGTLLPLPDAEAIEFIAVGKTRVFEGAAIVIDPPEEVGVDPDAPNGYNWKYELAEDDTEKVEDPGFAPWLKITWDGKSTPKRITWVKGGDKIPIGPAPE
jgi:hypothetical protein